MFIVDVFFLVSSLDYLRHLCVSCYPIRMWLMSLWFQTDRSECFILVVRFVITVFKHTHATYKAESTSRKQRIDQYKACVHMIKSTKKRRLECDITVAIIMIAFNTVQTMLKWVSHHHHHHHGGFCLLLIIFHCTFNRYFHYVFCELNASSNGFFCPLLTIKLEQTIK